MARAGVATIFHGKPDGSHGNGEQVAIGATDTLLYTNVAGTGIVDAVTLEVASISGSDRDILVKWFGTDTKSQVKMTIPAGQMLVVLDRRLLSGGGTVYASCAAEADVLNAYVEIYQYNIQG